MAARKTISKKLRFEVFKRDNFTCQYCGGMAPDVVLEVDHINPVANGGENDILNLVTSCFDCNRGKGKRKLTEKDEIKKQQEQLKQLNQKREQLKMMLDWREELNKFSDEQVEKFDELFSDRVNGSLTNSGKEKVKKWIDEFGLMEVIECMEISIRQYYNENDERTVEKSFNYIPKIANIRRKQKDDPRIAERNYVKAILKNRLSYVNHEQYARMTRNLELDDFNELKEIAKCSNNWTEFKNMFEEILGDDY